MSGDGAGGTNTSIQSSSSAASGDIAGAVFNFGTGSRKKDDFTKMAVLAGIALIAFVVYKKVK